MVLEPLPAVQTGAVIQVDLQVSGLGDFDEPALAVYDISVLFPYDLLSLRSVTFGDPLLGDQVASDALSTSDYDVRQSIIDATTGVVQLQQDAGPTLSGILYLYQPDTFVLASLTFDARQAGPGDLGILPFQLLEGQGNPIPVDFSGGAEVQAIPEPSSLALGIGGMAILGFWYGRHRRSV